MKKEKIDNINWRFWILVIAVSLTCFLTWNRFSITLTDNVKYDFHFRNLLEHLIWGFVLPILTTIFFFGFQILAKCKSKLNYKLGIGTGLFIFIVAGVVYYSTKWINGFILEDIPKIILDILGFGVAFWFIISGKTK